MRNLILSKVEPDASEDPLPKWDEAENTYNPNTQQRQEDQEVKDSLGFMK